MCVRFVNKVLKENPVFAVYQPIYRLDSEKIYGYEAFSRTSNINNPSIIELFERDEIADNIQDLDLVMMEQVIRRFNGKGKLFINMSEKSIDETIEYLEKMVTVATEVDLALEDIVIELTEKENWNQESLDKIKEFKSIYHFLLAINDFGVSFSNNLLLLDIPADIVKIDRIFIQSIYKNRQKRATVRAFIESIKANNVKIICKGIEEEAELNVLKNLGSDLDRKSVV